MSLHRITRYLAQRAGTRSTGLRRYPPTSPTSQPYLRGRSHFLSVAALSRGGLLICNCPTPSVVASMSGRSSASSKKQKRRKSTPRSRSTSVVQNQVISDTEFYEIRDIIDERILGGELQYKIDWADNPTTGDSYAPTWVISYTNLALNNFLFRPTIHIAPRPGCTPPANRTSADI